MELGHTDGGLDYEDNLLDSLRAECRKVIWRIMETCDPRTVAFLSKALETCHPSITSLLNGECSSKHKLLGEHL